EIPVGPRRSSICVGTLGTDADAWSRIPPAWYVSRAPLGSISGRSPRLSRLHLWKLVNSHREWAPDESSASFVHRKRLTVLHGWPPSQSARNSPSASHRPIPCSADSMPASNAQPTCALPFGQDVPPAVPEDHTAPRCPESSA